LFICSNVSIDTIIIVNVTVNISSLLIVITTLFVTKGLNEEVSYQSPKR